MTCALVWREAKARWAWQELCQLCESVAGPPHPTARWPQRVPWLGVVLTRGIVAHQDANEWLGDFERCLGWAILDTRP